MPRPLVVLVLARCVNRLGGFSMAFLGVHLATDLGASLAVVGVVLAAFGLATIPSRLLGGHLAGRVGPAPTMVAGLVSCAVAQLVVAAAPTLGWALAGAVLLGLAFEVVEPPSQALVADLADPADLPSAYALLWSTLAVAGVLAGGIAALVVRAGVAWLFVVDAATCLVCALVVALLLRVGAAPTTPAASTTPVRGGALAVAARDGRLLRHTALGTVFATAFMVVVFALPLTVDRLGLNPSTTGVLLAVEAAAGLAAQPLVRRVRDRVRSDASGLRLGYGVVALGLAVVALASGALGASGPALVVVLGAGLSVVAVGSTLTLGPLQAGAARLAPAWSRAAYLAVFGLSWGLATTLAPLVVSTLLQHGVVWPWVAAAALVAALAARPGRVRRVSDASASSRMTTTTPVRTRH